jgi:hypothetical protein
MKDGSILRALALPLLFAFGITVQGCDNPVGSGGGHPEGLVITTSAGAEVASYLAPTQTSTGRITVASGSEATFRIHLLARDGTRIDLDGIEYSIGDLSIVTGLFASATMSDVDALRVTGNTAGDTRIIVPVRHGNHAEFTAEIDLRIE